MGGRQTEHRSHIESISRVLVNGRTFALDAPPTCLNLRSIIASNGWALIIDISQPQPNAPSPDSLPPGGRCAQSPEFMFGRGSPLFPLFPVSQCFANERGS